MKKVWVFLFISLFLCSIFSIALVKAVDLPASDTATRNFCDDYKAGTETGFFAKRYCIWLYGQVKTYNPDGSVKIDNTDLLGETIKWLILLIVIALSYSSFSSANFPSSGGIRLLLSIVVGFLATFMITTSEMITLLHSYTALGVTFAVFLPILVLIFFTIIVASKASPIGIYFQKILWIIYGGYLLIKTGTLALIQWYYDPTMNGGAGGWKGVESGGFFHKFLNYIASPEILKDINNQNPVMLWLLIIVSIFIIFMAFNNKIILSWLAKEKLDSDVQAQQAKVQKSGAYDSIRAQAMDKG